MAASANAVVKTCPLKVFMPPIAQIVILSVNSNIMERRPPETDLFRQPEAFISLSTQTPDSFDKNRHFTSQSTGVAGLLLPRSVGVFVALCDFAVLTRLTCCKVTDNCVFYLRPMHMDLMAAPQPVPSGL